MESTELILNFVHFIAAGTFVVVSSLGYHRLLNGVDSGSSSELDRAPVQVTGDLSDT
jgi:hypothetical protein